MRNLNSRKWIRTIWEQGRGKGFTLVELLISLVIMFIVAGAAMMLGTTFSRNFTQSNELSMARERGIMVATYLENRILNTALGMPGAGSAGTDFTTAFNELLTGPSAASLTDWTGAVNIVGGNELLIAYGMPSGLFTVISSDCVAGNPVTVTLSGAPDGDKVSDEFATKTTGWVTFPSYGRAFTVQGIAGSDLTLGPKLSGYLSANSEMYYVRFLRSYASAGVFYAQDVTRQTAQPVVEGIIGCQFNWDPAGRILSVAILARGNVRSGTMVSPQTKAGWDGLIPDDDRYYYLSVVRRGWRIRN